MASFSGLGSYGSIANVNTLSYSSGALTTASQTFSNTPGAAYQLAKTTSAAGATNGSAFTTQPVITIQDQDGNTVTSGTQSTQNVVITTSSGTLSGTTTVPAVAGVATFTNVALTATAGSITLTYTISSPSSITATQSISLVAGAPTQLIVKTAAVGCNSRIACTTQPVIWIADA